MIYMIRGEPTCTSVSPSVAWAGWCWRRLRGQRMWCKQWCWVCPVQNVLLWGSGLECYGWWKIGSWNQICWKTGSIHFPSVCPLSCTSSTFPVQTLSFDSKQPWPCFSPTSPTVSSCSCSYCLWVWTWALHSPQPWKPYSFCWKDPSGPWYPGFFVWVTIGSFICNGGSMQNLIY